VQAIRGAITRRVLDLLAAIAKDEPDKYSGFWASFGNVLKEGVIEDPGNRERILPLLRFASTAADDRLSSAAEYISRMPAGQKDIYCLSADDAAVARASPQLEGLRARGIEVLLLTEHIDPWLIAQLDEIDGHRLTDAAGGDLSFDGLPPPAESAAEVTGMPELCTRVATALGERVAGVRTSRRLHGSASCLVRDAQDPGPQLRRLLEAAGQKLPPSKPWLELNPAHPLIGRLASLPEGDEFASLAALVADEATIADGAVPPDPGAFLKRLNEWLLR
jgi:molecular chaperone HtpG